MLHIRHTFKAHITVTYQNAAILESLYRTVTCRIAEFMAIHCTVNKVICTIEFTHGTCLKKRMTLIRCSDRLLFTCNANV